jgi:membrane-associated phospholipid phosphatase
MAVETPSTPAAAVAAVAKRIAPWMWLLPWVLLLLSSPLWLHWFEPTLFVSMNTAFAPVAATAWAGLSLLGNAWGLLGITSPLLVCAPRLMWAWLCAAPFAIVLVRTGKGLIESPRPAGVVDNDQIRVVGELLHNVSMPSGHTLTAFAVASALYFAMPVARRWRHSWLFVLAAGTGLSRIAVGAHWPGDVAVGASLGLLAGMLGQFLLDRMHPKHFQPTAWSLRLVALLVALALYHLLAEGLDFEEGLPVQYVVAGITAVSLIAFARQNWFALKQRVV